MEITDTEAGIPWKAVLATENEPTGDGRILAEGSLTWRETPLPLYVQLSQPAEGGHAESVLAGRIDTIWKDGLTVYAEGVFDPVLGAEAARLVSEGTLRGVSIDPVPTVIDIKVGDAPEMDEETGTARVEIGDDDTTFVAAEIRGATVTPMQAIESAIIELVTAEPEIVDDAVVASISPPMSPPLDWFAFPEDIGPNVALTVDNDGRIYGRIANFGTCHLGFAGGDFSDCVMAPRSAKDYAFFHLGELVADDDERVAVGTITIGTDHASLNMSRTQTVQHYSDTGLAAAYVRAYDDEHGIVVAGTLAAGIKPEQVQAMMAAKPSGDWRRVEGNLELVHVLAVNVPGFPVTRPQARVAAIDTEEPRPLAVVAAGTVEQPDSEAAPVEPETVEDEPQAPDFTDLASAARQAVWKGLLA